MKKRTIALILAIVMVLGLFAGCGKEEPSGQPGSEGKPGKPDAEQVQGIVYQSTTIPLTFADGLKVDYVDQIVFGSDRAYLSATVSVGEEPYLDEFTREPVIGDNGEPMMMPVQKTMLMQVDLQTGAVKPLAYETPEIPEGRMGGTWIGGLTLGADGTLWVTEQTNTYYYDVPENFNPETDDPYQYYVDEGSKTTCRQLDAQGKELKAVELQISQDDPRSIRVLSDGTILGWNWDGTVSRYDETGKEAVTATIEGFNSLVESADQSILVVCWNEEQNQLCTLDPQTLTLGAPIAMDKRAYMAIPGAGKYQYYFDNNGALYGVPESGAAERLFSWIDCDIDMGTIASQVTFQADGTAYAIQMNYDQAAEDLGGSFNLIRMTPMDASKVPQREELILACYYLDWNVRNQIIEFNKSQDKVRIKVKDYAEFGSAVTDNNVDAGIQKLNTDILSGIIPDIFYLNDNIPVGAYASKGILLDLWPLIDSDPELGRDALMSHFFDVLSTDGKLYQVTDRFAINTAVGLTPVVGTGSSWTLEELLAAYENMGEEATIFGEYDTKDGMLQTTVLRNIESFVNWETKQVSFDSQEFMDLLEFSDSFPAEFDESSVDWGSYQSETSRLLAGKQLLLRQYVGGFETMMSLDEALQHKASYIGYPTTGGNGSSFQLYGSFSISAKCKNPEAAWSFVRQYLTAERQLEMGADERVGLENLLWFFPTNKEAFEASVEAYMTPSYITDEETGEKIPVAKAYYWPDEGEGVEIYTMTQEVYDQFTALYENTNTVSSYNQEISNILMSECEAYFAGQKTAQETARLVQDRIGLYVMERG